MTYAYIHLSKHDHHMGQGIHKNIIENVKQLIGDEM
jgi:PII-like signaling protein